MLPRLLSGRVHSRRRCNWEGTESKHRPSASTNKTYCLQDRHWATIGGIDILPVQRPRHLYEVLPALLRVEIELLRIGKGDGGRLARFGVCAHRDNW
jgi:hypothetical protein